MTVHEEIRTLSEDLERLEQAVGERLLQAPSTIRGRLTVDHEVADFLQRAQDQAQRLRHLLANKNARHREVQAIATGEPMDEFYKQMADVKDFHRRYPNEPVENLERAYKRRAADEGEDHMASEIDKMFSGEEAYGRYLDMVTLHDRYLNLPGIKGGRRLTYLQYLDSFDHFTPPQCLIKRPDKMKDDYFQYLAALSNYLEDFMKRTKPLENLDKLFAAFQSDFNTAWKEDTVPGWSKADAKPSTAPKTEGTGQGLWCADCEKEFNNENVYKSHLTGKKHLNAVKTRSSKGSSANAPTTDIARQKERAIADREYRVSRLASAMQTERADTRANVERRQGMTERERQQEIEAVYAEAAEPANRDADDDAADDDDDKIYNPLKLPLAWDGKPIPFWLYKLHGLGNEFDCEICGNYTYFGRRAFEKHFGEARHLYGLKCLGITNTALFREIKNIEEAVKLQQKLVMDEKQKKSGSENVVQMEDSEGNIMPEKVYYDLQKQGLV